MRKWLWMAAGVCSVLWAASLRAAPATVVVSPLCKPTEAWNQAGALNAMVEAFCGCDPLAWGQVVTYHGLTTKFPAADWKPTPITDWVQFPNGASVKVEWRTTTEGGYNWENVRDQGEDVSRLMWDFGILGHTLYAPGASSGTVSNTRVAAYMDYQGVGWRYTKPIYQPEGASAPILHEAWPETAERLIRGALHAGAPLVVTLTNAAGGHAIICDGYGYAEDGALMAHLHYGWGTGSDRWVPMSWFWEYPSSGDTFMVMYVNVHPYNLKCILAGTVRQGEQPLPGVKVTLSNGKEVTTDASGGYCFTGLDAQTSYTVTASPAGCVAQSYTVTTGRFVDDDLKAQLEDENKNGDKGGYVPLESGSVLADFTFAPPKIYVRAEGLGDGSSWGKAAALSATMLKTLPSGAEVLVASGEYAVRETLTLPEGVTLRGGYLPETGQRNSYGSPSILRLTKAANGTIPSYLLELKTGAVAEGFELVNDETWSGSTVSGGTVERCLFRGAHTVIAQNTLLRACLARNTGAEQEGCSLIHCTFYGAIPVGKDGGTMAGNLGNVTQDFPEAKNLGRCTCGSCPETGLNLRPLQKTWGALAVPAEGCRLQLN